MTNDPTQTEEFTRFKKIVTDYYEDENNQKIFAKLTTKERLGLSELGLITLTKRLKSLETWRKIHEMVMIVLGLAVLILTFTKG